MVSIDIGSPDQHDTEITLKTVNFWKVHSPFQLNLHHALVKKCSNITHVPEHLNIMWSEYHFQSLFSPLEMITILSKT